MEFSGRVVERPWSGPCRRLKGNQSSRGSVEGEGGPEGFVKGKGGGDKVLHICCKVKIGKNRRFSLVRGGGKRSARKVRSDETMSGGGWWGDNSAPLPELDFVRRWTHQYWPLKGNLSVAMLG